jgi:uncharacterized membrane protein
MSNAVAPNDAGRNRGRWFALALVAGVIAYEVLTHLSVVSGRAAWLSAVMSLAPLLACTFWLAVSRRRPGYLALTAVLAVAVAVLVTMRTSGPEATVFYPVSSVVIYALLFWMFARTLMPGREALVTRLARHVHGTLPDEITVYTRRVTWAWSLFFFVMAATSILLFDFASLAAWSLFANVLNLPLVALMFVVEYAYRIQRYRDFAHVPLLTAVRAFRQFGRQSASPGHGG